jgi:hypothetical protein
MPRVLQQREPLGSRTLGIQEALGEPYVDSTHACTSIRSCP